MDENAAQVPQMPPHPTVDASQVNKPIPQRHNIIKPLIIIFIVILLIIGIILISPKEQEQKTAKLVVPTKPYSSPTVMQANSVKKIQTGNWTQYSDVAYIVKYPADWKAEGATSSGGIHSIIIRPKGQSEGTFTPSFAIDTYDASIDAQAEDATDHDIQTFKFTEAATTVSGLSGVKLEGNAPFQIIDGNYVQKTSYNVVYRIGNTMHTFILRYQYDGKKMETNYEELFQGIISTFAAK